MSSFIPGLILSNVGEVTASIVTAFQTRVINAVNTNYGMTVQAEVSMSVNQVGFNFSTITGAPGNITISIGTVDAATGVYGTDLATATVAANTLTYSTAGAINWITLNTTVNLTRGQFYSIRLRTAATGWDATNNITMYYGGVTDDGPTFGNSSIPYGVSGSSKVFTSIGGVRNSTTGTVYGCVVKSPGVTDGSVVGTYQGSVFTLPSAWSSASMIGICFCGRFVGNTTDTWSLYSVSGTTGTLVSTVTIDSDYVTNTAPHVKYVYLTGNLTGGTTYFIGRNGVSTNTNFLQHYQFTNTAEADPYQRGGFTIWSASLNTTGNVVTTLTDRIALCFPVFSSVTKTTGGSGGSYTTNFNGGFNG